MMFYRACLPSPPSFKLASYTITEDGVLTQNVSTSRKTRLTVPIWLYLLDTIVMRCAHHGVLHSSAVTIVIALSEAQGSAPLFNTSSDTTAGDENPADIAHSRGSAILKSFESSCHGRIILGDLETRIGRPHDRYQLCTVSFSWRGLLSPS